MSNIAWNDFNPFISFANRLVCLPDYVFGPRTIVDHQFIYVAAGKGIARIQQNEYEALPGDLFYYGPEIVHRFQADGDTPFTLYGIHFSLNAPLERNGVPSYVQLKDIKDFNTNPIIENELRIGNDQEKIVIVEKLNDNSSWIEGYLQRLVSQFERSEISSHLRNRALMIQFLLELNQQSSHSLQPASNKTLLINGIAEKLTERAALNYDRGWLSEWNHYHVNHVSRIFSEHYGKAPNEYFLQAKMDLAKQLLGHNKEATIGEIAEQLNFSSIHYFSKVFKERTGYKPSAYRKMRSSI